MMFAGQNNVSVKQTNIMIIIGSDHDRLHGFSPQMLKLNIFIFVPTTMVLSKKPKYCQLAMIIIDQVTAGPNWLHIV